MTNYSFAQTPPHIIANKMYAKGMKKAKQEVYDKLGSKFKQELMQQVKNRIIKIVHDDEVKRLEKEIYDRVMQLIFSEAYERVENEITLLKNKHHPVMLPNLTIVYDVPKQVKGGWEEYVRDKFIEMGYKANDCRKKAGSHPDWIFTKGIERIHVEVKAPGDGLRGTQAKWIKDNPKKKVIIYFIGG